MGRVYKRPARTGAPLRLPKKWSNPLAISRNVKFHYADSGFPITTGVSGVPSTIVHTNVPYDPYFTGIGVQPYDWDTLVNATEYYNYYPIACKCTVRFYFTGAPNTVICSLVASPRSSLTYNGSDDLRANPDCVQRTMNEVSKGTVTLTLYRTCRRMTHRDPSDMIANYASATPTAGKFYFHAIADSTNMGEAVGVGCDVDIIYYTRIMRDDTVNES